MTSKSYQTRAGVTQCQPVLSEAEFLHHDYLGFCLACGDYADSIEPDARRLRCETCGQRKVYGLPELLIMALLVLAEPDSDAQAVPPG